MSQLQAPGLAGRSSSGLLGEGGAAAYIRRAQSSPGGISGAPGGYSLVNGGGGLGGGMAGDNQQQALQQQLQRGGGGGQRGGKSGTPSLAQALLDPECQGIDTSSTYCLHTLPPYPDIFFLRSILSSTAHCTLPGIWLAVTLLLS